MKKRIQQVSLFLLVVILFSGCVYYKTLEITPVSESSVEDMYAFKKQVIVHAEDVKQQFWLTSVDIDSFAIGGIIQKLPNGKMHKPHDNSFEKKNVSPNDPLNTMHLYTNLQEIKMGEIQISFQVHLFS